MNKSSGTKITCIKTFSYERTWKANSSTSSQNNTRNLWKAKDHYYIHETSTRVSQMSQSMHTTAILKAKFWCSHLHLRLLIPTDLFTSDTHTNYCTVSPLSHKRHVPLPFFSLDLISRIQFFGQHRSRIFSLYKSTRHPLPRDSYTILLNTYLLTYSMVQSPSWAADWLAASQEIPRI